jgi:hypothetical protein
MGLSPRPRYHHRSGHQSAGRHQSTVCYRAQHSFLSSPSTTKGSDRQQIGPVQPCVAVRTPLNQFGVSVPVCLITSLRILSTAVIYSIPCRREALIVFLVSRFMFALAPYSRAPITTLGIVFFLSSFFFFSLSFPPCALCNHSKTVHLSQLLSYSATLTPRRRASRLTIRD